MIGISLTGAVPGAAEIPALLIVAAAMPEGG
jgi:hypothetical protein